MSACGATGSGNGFCDRQTLTDLWSFPRGIACDRTGPEQLSGLCEQLPVAGAQQAVIADFDEAMRQHVLEKPPNELLGRHRTHFDLRRGRFLVLKGDLAVGQLEHAVIADGHPENRRGQISKSLMATADRLTVHDPILVPYVLIDAWEQIGLLQSVSELRNVLHGPQVRGGHLGAECRAVVGAMAAEDVRELDHGRVPKEKTQELS